MMKRISRSSRFISLILSCALLLTGCAGSSSSDSTKDTSVNSGAATTTHAETTQSVQFESEKPTFEQLSDPDLAGYIEDDITAEIESRLASDDYHIDNIASIYVSKEYIETLEYNSKKNIFFGYTLDELDKQFQGKRYVFTLGDDGKTVVKEMEKYDDSYIKMLKDVAIGAGVILFCVSVSVATSGTAVGLIFAASAKTGATMALSGGTIGGLTSGIVTGIQTGDMEQALKAAGTAGAEGFKIGAISGAIAGGASETFKILKSGSKVKDAVSSGEAPQIGKTSEEYVQQYYPKGENQVSYIGGKEVEATAKGATRPDIVLKNPDGTVKAIEIKNHDLSRNLSNLKHELKRQVSDRVANLPTGSTQEIALVTKGRGYSKELIDSVIKELQTHLSPTYGGNIPITVY